MTFVGCRYQNAVNVRPLQAPALVPAELELVKTLEFAAGNARHSIVPTQSLASGTSPCLAGMMRSTTPPSIKSSTVAAVATITIGHAASAHAIPSAAVTHTVAAS